MLAFPFNTPILELALGRVKLFSLGIHNLTGFALVVAGYVVFAQATAEMGRSGRNGPKRRSQ